MTEREIFFEALEMATPEARAAYLQGVCGRDVTLRRKVDDLLKDHFPNDSLLAGPALEGERPTDAASPAQEAPAHKLGRYKLLEKIGEGGFGDIWIAEQEEPVRRRVALKIIKLGMDNMRAFPLCLVSNLSAPSALPLVPGLFDLVTIDEASQCDIPSVVPLLARSKRAVFAGDPIQPKHVITLDDADRESPSSSQPSAACRWWASAGWSGFMVLNHDLLLTPVRGFAIVRKIYGSSCV